jgi:hypothetical protein
MRKLILLLLVVLLAGCGKPQTVFRLQKWERVEDMRKRAPEKVEKR